MNNLLRISKLFIIGVYFFGIPPLYAAHQTQELEKKVAASDQLALTMQQSVQSTAKKLYTVFQAQAQQASERVRSLIRSPDLVRSIPFLLMDLTIAFMIARSLETGFDPLSRGEIVSALLGLTVLPTAVHGVSVDIVATRLANAIRTNDIEAVRYLLDTTLIYLTHPIELSVPGPGIFIDGRLEPFDHMTPLMAALLYNRPEIFRLLLENGAPLDEIEMWGRSVQDELSIQPQDPPARQDAKRAMKKIVLEYRLSQHYAQKQKQLREEYEPVETVAADALEELHTALYGKSGLGQVKNITDIIGSYLTPEYVTMPRKKYPTIPIAHPVKESKKKTAAQEKKKND